MPTSTNPGLEILYPECEGECWPGLGQSNQTVQFSWETSENQTEIFSREVCEIY